MVPEQDLRLEARLAAIELLLNNLWVKYYLAIGATYDQIMTSHANTIEGLRNETIPGLDAASSDLAASEIEHAVRMLLDEQKQLLEAVKDSLGRL